MFNEAEHTHMEYLYVSVILQVPFKSYILEHIASKLPDIVSQNKKNIFLQATSAAKFTSKVSIYNDTKYFVRLKETLSQH